MSAPADPKRIAAHQLAIVNQQRSAMGLEPLSRLGGFSGKPRPVHRSRIEAALQEDLEEAQILERRIESTLQQIRAIFEQRDTTPIEF